jgi:hypothetical protein
MKTSRYCRSCGQQVNEKAVACTGCGCPPMTPGRYCYGCAAEVPAAAVMCVKCGVALGAGAGSGTGPVAPGSLQPQSKVLCVVLAICVPLGIHRFLMGHKNIGLAQLIGSILTVGILCWWSWIDAILILTGSLKMADGQELT